MRLLLLSLLIATPISAHEFWIDPKAFQIENGEPVIADIRVGENFKGGAQAFLPRRIARFAIVSGRTIYPVKSTVGDRPALNMEAPEGLAIIVHETRDASLTYREWEKFVKFDTHKDLGAVEAHLSQGLPQTDFEESYRRFAKSLVAVGSGAGSDLPVGMRTELVALANPYTDDLSAGLPVLLLYEGQPRVDEQIEIYERAPSGEIVVSLVRTDTQGRASVPVKPGHVYQLDAVKAIPGERDGVAWHTMWANLTFAVPE